MSETPIFHDGVEVSIAHLAPTEILCPCEEIMRDLVIAVDFRNHCYTEKFDADVHAREQIVLYDAPGRPRVFCPIRHALSLHLPAIICTLPSNKVFQSTSRRNYVFVARLAISNQLYEVYFMLQRAGNDAPGHDLRLTVESAYPVETATETPKRPGRIRFPILALKVLKGQPVKFGPR